MEQLQMVTDAHLRSLLDYGSSDFPFKYYSDDLLQYDRHTIDWHWHRSFELTFVSSGAVTLSIMSENYVLNRGDLLFLNSGAIHRFSSVEGGALRNLLFAPEFISSAESRAYRDCIAPILQSGPMFLIIRADAPGQEAVRTAFQACLAANEADDGILYSLNQHAAVVDIWRQLIPSVHGLNQSSRCVNSVAQKRVQTMLMYIHRNYGGRLSLKDIAASASISTRECLRSFEMCIQTSPVAYLNEYRIRIARRQLTDRGSSVTEIAISCGFDNPGYFSKVFRRACGMSPSEYRGASEKQERNEADKQNTEDVGKMMYTSI